MKATIAILLVSLICLDNYNLSAQNAPISTIGSVETYIDTVIVPITVTEFTNIGACDLLLNYDPAVATATSVTLGPGIGYYIFLPNIQTPGIISLSWLFFQYGVPGLTLPDDAVFMNITFARASYGYSAIEFDNSLPNNCLYTDDNFDELNDIPYSTYYIDGSITFEMINAPITRAPDIETCQGLTSIDIPATVSDFYQIGAFNLTMQYDAQVYSYQSFTNNSGFPGLEVIDDSSGTIVIDGITNAAEGFTLDNNSILCTLHFNNLGGSTSLTWIDLGESCEYRGPAPDYELLNDNPQSTYYINGSFTELPVPAAAGIITGPVGGTVCQGENGVVFSISPVTFADSYEWTLPEGATIESGEGTHEISVSFSENATSGNVSVFGINECGNGITSPAFPIIIEMVPAIINQPVSPDTVYAGDGIASFSVIAEGTNLSYQWQEHTDDWSDISDGGLYAGSTTSFLTITNPPASMNGNYYRCIVSGNCNPPAITDGNAILTVIVLTGLNINNFGNGYESLNFRSFPNPFSKQIAFSFNAPSEGIVAIEICNVYGEKVMILNKTISAIDENLVTINTMQLNPGIYAATITFKNKKAVIRNTIKIIAKSD